MYTLSIDGRTTTHATLCRALAYLDDCAPGAVDLITAHYIAGTCGHHIAMLPCGAIVTLTRYLH